MILSVPVIREKKLNGHSALALDTMLGIFTCYFKILQYQYYYAYVIKERIVVQKIKDAKGARQGGEQGLTTIGHRVSAGVMKMF